MQAESIPSWNARAAARSLVTIASEWPEPYCVDVVDRLLDGVDDPHGQDQREELLGPVGLASPQRPTDRSRARARRRAARRPARAAPPARAAGTSAATAECTSSVSAALHMPGRWTLALTMIRSAIARSAVAST